MQIFVVLVSNPSPSSQLLLSGPSIPSAWLPRFIICAVMLENIHRMPWCPRSLVLLWSCPSRRRPPNLSFASPLATIDLSKVAPGSPVIWCSSPPQHGARLHPSPPRTARGGKGGFSAFYSQQSTWIWSTGLRLRLLHHLAASITAPLDCLKPWRLYSITAL